MHLFRIAALINEPLPWIFSLVLAMFLLTWSLGVFAAGRLPVRLELWLFLTAVTVGVVPVLYRLARWELPNWPAPFVGRIGLSALCFVPCFFFGVLFTQIITRFARSWGQDVGYYFAANTFGSCLGVVLATLIGFEFPPEGIPWAIFLGLILLLAGHRFWAGDARPRFVISAVAIRRGCPGRATRLVVRARAELRAGSDRQRLLRTGRRGRNRFPGQSFLGRAVAFRADKE